MESKVNGVGLHSRTHRQDTRDSLLLLLALEPGRAVRERDVELRRALDDGLPLKRRHVVRDLSAVLPVVHEKELEVLDVAHDELEEAARENVAGLLVAPVADVRLGPDPLELTALAAIDTARVPPRFLDGDLTIVLVPASA